MSRGKLRSEEKQFTRLINQQWTEAQLSHAGNYRSGFVVQFHQNAPGLTRGQKVTVSSVTTDGVVHVKDERGCESVLPRNLNKPFQVYEAETLRLAAGNRVRMTQNGYALDGRHRLNNGAVYEVKGFTRDGDLKLNNGWVIARDYGNIAHGYCHLSRRAEQDRGPRLCRTIGRVPGGSLH